jgi:hypothetical protein
MTLRSQAAEAIKVSDTDGNMNIVPAGRDRAVRGEGFGPVASTRPGLLALLLI